MWREKESAKYKTHADKLNHLQAKRKKGKYYTLITECVHDFLYSNVHGNNKIANGLKPF